VDKQRPTGLVHLVQEAAPLRRKITASLRQAIEIGTLKAGERLVEKDLCSLLNVSRTSLREALRELEAEGLVVKHPRGLVVTQVTEQEANNIYSVRAALEGLVAEQFAQHATPQAQDELKKVVDRLDKAYAKRHYDQILSMKKEFYDTLFRGANNLIVLDVLNRLNSRITQLRSASLSDPARGIASMAEIRNLTDALLARDVTAARAAAIYHVMSAAKYTENRRRIAEAEAQAAEKQKGNSA